jgi:hypothetical protein
MVPTPGFVACDDMGAAFAGVFCGVLETGWLASGTSMAAVVEMLCRRGSKIVLRGRRDLRSGDGVHLLIADWLRHLGRSLMSICRWRIVEGSGVVGERSAEMFGGLSESLLVASLCN